MSYSDKVIAHFENPQNVGALDKNDPNVGTGLVGAPACGDVMRLQIKVNEQGVIEDAKFKTFGCLTGNNYIATPNGYIKIKKLKSGDKIWAWDGEKTVVNIVKHNNKKNVHFSDLLILDFGLPKNILCTKDHVWWSSDARPILAEDLPVNSELLCLTKNELSSMNNFGRTIESRSFHSQRMKNFNSSFDHSLLPQNKKGFVHSLEFRKKISAASIRNWKNEDYIKNWQIGMSGASKIRPTSLEKDFIELFQDNNVDARYVGNGQFWITSNGQRFNPDFKVNGQRKVIEVYTRNLPHFMQNRESNDWMILKKEKYAAKNFDCMFIEHSELKNCLSDVQRFIHNGISLLSKKCVTHKNELRGTDYCNEMVPVYSLELEYGANLFFVQRVMSHNCGSAIASSSLATEWLKGKSLDEAENIRNSMIAEELILPPLKTHCSVLAEDAIKSAIADFREKQKIFLHLSVATVLVGEEHKTT